MSATFKKDLVSDYFSQNDYQQWSLSSYEQYVNELRSRKRPLKSIRSEFLNHLQMLKNDSETSEKIKKHAEALIAQDGESDTSGPATSSNTTININSNNINSNNINSDVTTGVNIDLGVLFDDSTLSSLPSSQQSTNSQSSQASSGVNPPSDITVDYHPLRTAEYHFVDPNADDEEVDTDETDEWIVDDVNVSQKCRDIKANTVNLTNAPESLSDLRLLCLNDMYLFEQELDRSISRYFGSSSHRRIITSIHYKQYSASSPSNAWKWCNQVKDNAPFDYIESLAVCAGFTIEATTSKNLVDIHTAQVLNDLLPSFLFRPPNAAIEDTFVQAYLSPALRSVFVTHERLQYEWANAALSSDEVKYKPDFKVFTQILNKKLMLVVTEIKPPTSHSSVESDTVKLGRQMKYCFNQLVLSGVPSPVVCGLKFDGFFMETYAMDMTAPKIYRIFKLASVDIYRDLSQFTLIPTIVSYLLQIRSIAVKVAKDAESTILAANNDLRQPEPSLPPSWLTYDHYVLTRKRRRT
ncbi:hypothetical protein MUCCIDRAFT_111155 [Mucor lusitanicus CBS 277.49]|uniref:Uncharacterized protein n=2 Tax=Mucor circinelloides f. lusitanicus TaxID=29924 RepID=A0A168JZU8_MUCCL|nr:hypothetical protein MUCCIDRAFT_111155 [Mucor lusitanicus CBS 277.49]